LKDRLEKVEHLRMNHCVVSPDAVDGIH